VPKYGRTIRSSYSNRDLAHTGSARRSLPVDHLGQLSIIEGGINNRRKISYRFEFLQEIFDLVALLYIGADWVGATD